MYQYYRNIQNWYVLTCYPAKYKAMTHYSNVTLANYCMLAHLLYLNTIKLENGGTE